MLAVFVLLAAAAPALAQSNEVLALRDRMARLELELNELKRAAAHSAAAGGGATRRAGGAMPSSLAAQLDIRLNQLEATLRRITGRLEELTHDLDQQRQSTDKLAKDMEFRMGAVERGTPPGRPAVGAGTAPRPAGTIPPTGATPGTPAAAVLPTGTAEEQYQYAKSLLRRADYEAAAAALMAFVDAHPDGALTGNAVYWLGETYYVRGDYARAAVQFADGYRRFPDHPKGPGNLLKLGLSLAKLGKKREACASLGQLVRKYPNAGASVSRPAAAERKRLGCR